MLRFVPTAAVCILAVAVSCLAPASAKDTSDRSDWFDPYEVEYLDTYEKAHAAGHDVGRNIVDDGLEDGSEPTQSRVEESTARMDAWLNPPPAPVETTAAETTSYSAPAPVSSGGGCPSYMAGEASSPDAVNPSSGAAGCYQVIPSTAAAMGSACSDVNAQSCVDAICAAQGNDAWVAADPCGYKGRVE